MNPQNQPPIEEIVRRFKAAQGNTITALAKELGVSRPTLYAMVEPYIEKPKGKRKSA